MSSSDRSDQVLATALERRKRKRESAPTSKAQTQDIEKKIEKETCKKTNKEGEGGSRREPTAKDLLYSSDNSETVIHPC